MSTTVWGNAVGPWRVGLRYDVVQLVGGGATISAAVVVQSSNAISETYSEAWLACDGQSSGGGGHAISAAAGQVFEVVSHVFTVAADGGGRSVRVAASLLMPAGADVPGTSYAETTVQVQGSASSAPSVPTLTVAHADNGATFTVTAAFGDPTKAADRVTVQRRTNLGEWQTALVTLVSSTSPSASLTRAEPPSAMLDYRAQASNAIGVSAWTATQTLLTKPTAVASLNAEFDADAGDVALTWSEVATPYATAYEVQKSSDGLAWTDAATVAMAAWTDADPPVGTAHYRVRARATSLGTTLHGEWRATSVGTLTTADYPQVTVSQATVHDLPWSVSWTAAPGAQHHPLASQTVRVVVGGAVVHEADVPVGTTTLSVPDLAGTGSATVSVTDSHGLTTTKSALVVKDFWPPVEPSATVEAVGNALRFTPTAGGGASKAATESFLLVRGGAVVAACLPGGTLTDALTPINVATAYKVVARAANGLSAEHAVTATLALDHGAVDAMGRSFDVLLDPEVSESAQRGGESLQLAGDELPTWFGDGTLSASVRLGFTVLADGFADLRNVARFADVAEVRSPDGRCWHGHPSWTFERDMEGAEKVRVTLTEVLDAEP